MQIDFPAEINIIFYIIVLSIFISFTILQSITVK